MEIIYVKMRQTSETDMKGADVIIGEFYIGAPLPAVQADLTWSDL